MSPVLEFDAASAVSKGRRSYQEDAIIADFSRGSDIGLVVLADGMGGHAAGDVASKIVVTEVFSELLFQSSDPEDFEQDAPGRLRRAAVAANDCLRQHVDAFPNTRGMGATLVACAIVAGNLYWISIGDSPLYLFRDGALTQLNEDHSMAPQIDFMVKSGLMAAEEGARHPDRNTLTSVLYGEDVAKVDCPKDPFGLKDGDILIVASDGLQFLSNDTIGDLLRSNLEVSSREIADLLMQEVMATGDPDLDNVSFSLIKFEAPSAAQRDMSDAAVFTGLRCAG